MNPSRLETFKDELGKKFDYVRFSRKKPNDSGFNLRELFFSTAKSVLRFPAHR